MGSANTTPVGMDLGRDPRLFLWAGNITLGNLLCQPVHPKAWSTQLGSWHSVKIEERRKINSKSYKAYRRKKGKGGFSDSYLQVGEYF